MEELQEYAELTSHSNFSESTETILDLICTVCPKSCRLEIESDLHARRIMHIEFVDKTSEPAKPISLEVPKATDESREVVDASDSSSQPQEMIAPEVDKKLLEEFEVMGFPMARVTRALPYLGNTSLETAVS